METFSSLTDKNLIEWTGLAPVHGLCPGVGADGKIMSLPLLNLLSTRQQILDYFNNAWTMTEVLFSGLTKAEAFYRRPYHQLRHPLIFYYGHPATLYVNKLRVAGLIKDPVDADFERLFETGVDEMSWDDLHEGKEDIWPSLQHVTNYRKKVYALVSHLIKTHPAIEVKNGFQKSPSWALFMGFEHERIHFETSSVLMRELPAEFLKKPQAWPESDMKNSYTSLPFNNMLSVPSQEVSLGKPQDWPSFGWDNEYGQETRQCPSFSASEFLVSNAEFKKFVQAGGYSTEKYWSADGWAWRSFRNIKWPTFWVSTGPAGLHDYKLRTIFEVIEMPSSWPVCVNFHEAKAYCAWRTEHEKAIVPYRLLTESEHHAIRNQSEQAASNVAQDSVMASDWRQKGYNLNFSTGTERAVNAGIANNKGFYDSFGNVWQWSESFFHPLKDAKPHPYYEDFSVPCYDGRHQMIFGGSFVSTGDLASIWARFHFRPHFFQHAGFRLVQSEQPQSSGSLLYESKEMLNKYMLMHWGTSEEILDQVPTAPRPSVVHLPQKCADLILKYASGFESALDLGCAVGRSSFELARKFKHVMGIDYSREFIDCANQLKNLKKLSYWRKDSGSQGKPLTALIDADIDSTRLEFQQGDACALSSQIKNFDAVLLANVLCRLPDPIACLKRMQEGPYALVKPGGVLVMTTPLSWLEEYTPKSKWLNGLEEIKKILTEFELIHQEELPFVIREHQRKFEYIITQASVWKRRLS